MDNQELGQYLSTLATVAGGGALLWLLMGLLVKAAPGLNENREAKFWIAFVGSFLIPTGALAVKAAYLGETTTIAEWVTAVSAGYQISQSVHRATSQVKAKIEENEAKAKEEEVKAMAAQPPPYFVGKIPQGHRPPTLPIAPAAPRFEDTDYTNSGDAIPFPDGERGASGGR